MRRRPESVTILSQQTSLVLKSVGDLPNLACQVHWPFRCSCRLSGAPQRPRRKRESGASESKQDDAHIDKRLETATGQPILPAPTHAWLQPADTGLVDRRASFPPQSIPGLAFPSPRSNASIGGQSSPAATKGNPLSAIMHPNHEPASHAASPTRTEDVLGDGPLPREQLNKISQACKGLGISLELCEKLWVPCRFLFHMLSLMRNSLLLPLLIDSVPASLCTLTTSRGSPSFTDQLLNRSSIT